MYKRIKAVIDTSFFENLTICIILFSGLILRISFDKSINGPISVSDTPTYLDGAMSIYYHLSVNVYRPPVYPIGLMVVGILFLWENLSKNIVILQTIISLINIFFIYKLSKEAFKRKSPAILASFITATSYRIYSWDFVVLTENFSILLVTLIAYFTLKYISLRNKKYLILLSVLIITAILTKPFFLALPLASVLIIIFAHVFSRTPNIKSIIKPLAACLAGIYSCIFLYCAVNYIENGFFGLTSVGNVNYFGKILQYKMERLGDNEILKEDIKAAFKTEPQEYKVNGEYLEPWHFLVEYGWSGSYFSEAGRFAADIIISHPAEYVYKSLELTGRLFIWQNPFKDYIADSALMKANHTHKLVIAAKKLSDKADSLYPLLAVFLFEAAVLLIFRKAEAVNKFIILAFILYHYAVAAFFSYGDYCRLLVPCYPLIYTVICIYIFRIFTAAGYIINKILKPAQ